jgi:hypothetical protein
MRNVPHAGKLRPGRSTGRVAAGIISLAGLLDQRFDDDSAQEGRCDQQHAGAVGEEFVCSVHGRLLKIVWLISKSLRSPAIAGFSSSFGI